LPIIGDRIDAFTDFGCADGTLLEAVANVLPKVPLYGIDMNSDMLVLAEEKVPTAKLTQSKLPTNGWGALNLSSVLHEVNSYCNENEQKDFWAIVNDACFETIYHWDYIIIRDMVYNDIETSHSRANDVIAVKNPTRKTPSIDKYMYTAPHTFLDRLEEFESIWGDINIKKNLVHFLLKYRYVQNWNREVRENYLGYSTDDIINHIDSDKYELIYRKDYVLPFLQKRVYDDFGIFLDTPTHTNLIFKRR
jgi:hypothetical protein